LWQKYRKKLVFGEEKQFFHERLAGWERFRTTFLEAVLIFVKAYKAHVIPFPDLL